MRDGLAKARAEIAEKAFLRKENERLRAQVAALMKVKEAAARYEQFATMDDTYESDAMTAFDELGIVLFDELGIVLVDYDKEFPNDPR